MLFLLNATALFWSSNKEEAGRPLGRPLQMRSMGPLATNHEPRATNHEPRATNHESLTTSHEPLTTSH